jgi:hypothetical protein
LPLDTSTVASRHDELLRQVCEDFREQGFVARQVARTMKLGADENTRDIHRSPHFCRRKSTASPIPSKAARIGAITLICARGASAAVTISVERKAGLFVIGLFSWSIPVFAKTIGWIAE